MITIYQLYHDHGIEMKSDLAYVQRENESMTHQSKISNNSITQSLYFP